MRRKPQNKKKAKSNEIEELTIEQIDAQNHVENLELPTEQISKPDVVKKLRKPAWIDKNDEEISVDISKLSRLRKLRKTEDEKTIKGDEYQDRLQEFYSKKLKNIDFFKWSAAVPTENKEEEGVYTSEFKDILNRDLNLYESSYEELPNQFISINKIGNLLRKDHHNAVVQTLDFHENNEIFLSAGYDKLMKLYSVKKEENYGLYTDEFKKSLKVLKNVFFEDFPLQKCSFMHKKNQILCCGLKKHLLVYDILAEKTEKFASNLFTSFFTKQINNYSLSKDGNYIALNNEKGDIVIISAKNMEYLFHLKSNEPCIVTHFTNDSKYLFSAGVSGKIYQWDLQKRQIFDCVRDAGASTINCLGLSSNDNLIASGGLNGIVNIYERNAKTKKIDHHPLKEIQNLTTSITGLEINSKGEMMVISSKWKKRAVRLVHLGTKTVFSNWPNMKTNLQFVTSLKMSENCKYITFGNDEGNVFLYNFKHYNGIA